MGVEMTVRTHTLRADEPADIGGADAAPTPIELLLGALASCTSITMRMYATRKGWALGAIHVDTLASVDRASTLKSVTLTLRIEGDLDAAQRTRLLEIAHKCPVHRALVGGVEIVVRDDTPGS